MNKRDAEIHRQIANAIKNVVTFPVLADLAIEPTLPSKSSANPPAAATIQNFDFLRFDRATVEEMFLHYEIPNNYKDGGDMRIHVDFVVRNPPAATNEAVVWGIEYKQLVLGDVWDATAGTTTATVTAVIVGGETADITHRSPEIALVTTGFASGDTVLMRIFRDATNAADTYDNEAVRIDNDAWLYNLHIECRSEAMGTRPIIWPVTDDFAGLGPSSVEWVDKGTWTEGNGVISNSPTVGPNLLTNSYFENANWTGDDPDDWAIVEGGGVTEISQVGTGEGHGGTGLGMCNIWRSGGGGANDPRMGEAGILTTHSWYRVNLLIDTVNSGTIRVRDNGIQLVRDYTTTGNKVFTDRVTTGANFQMVTTADPTDITVDHVEVRLITENTLFSTIESEHKDIDVQIDIVDDPSDDFHAGVIACLDDTDTPANYLLAYHNGTDAKLDKVVAGVTTSLLTVAVAFAANAEIRIVKVGTSVELHYNGAQRGATQTVSDAGIISNTKHGKFSTDSSITLNDFSMTDK